MTILFCFLVKYLEGSIVEEPQREPFGLPDSATKLKANIQAVSHEQATLTLDFVEQEKEWVLAIADLQPGLDRVTVQTENTTEQSPTRVHDLFEVVRYWSLD